MGVGSGMIETVCFLVPPRGKRRTGKPGLKIMYAVIVVAVLILFSGHSVAGNEQEARDLVSGTLDQILVDLKNADATQRKSQTFYEDLVERRLVPLVNLVDVSRLVIGREAWTNASEEQRARFAEAFKTRLKKTYAQAIQLVSDVEIEYPDLPQPKRFVLVASVVTPPGQSQASYRVDYIFRQKTPWKIIDIRFEDISLVKLFRDSYAETIRNQGLEVLIQRLKNQTVPLVQELP